MFQSSLIASKLWFFERVICKVGKFSNLGFLFHFYFLFYWFEYFNLSRFLIRLRLIPPIRSDLVRFFRSHDDFCC